MIKSMILAGCGGFVGTCMRYLVGRWAPGWFPGNFPVGTLLVNLAGCLLIGFLSGLCERSNLLSANENLLLVTGFCGGFTTFSTFANDLWTMGNRGDWMTGMVYLCLSVILGVLLVWGGRAIIR